jgi:hypothetical protein
MHSTVHESPVGQIRKISYSIFGLQKQVKFGQYIRKLFDRFSYKSILKKMFALICFLVRKGLEKFEQLMLSICLFFILLYQ